MKFSEFSGKHLNISLLSLFAQQLPHEELKKSKFLFLTANYAIVANLFEDTGLAFTSKDNLEEVFNGYKSKDALKHFPDYVNSVRLDNSVFFENSIDSSVLVLTDAKFFKDFKGEDEDFLNPSISLDVFFLHAEDVIGFTLLDY